MNIKHKFIEYFDANRAIKCSERIYEEANDLNSFL